MLLQKNIALSDISIPPPLAGRDILVCLDWSTVENFNPPAPRGTGRNMASPEHLPGGISIHPPLAGRDESCWPLPS